jgi:cytochrome P450 family 110
MTRDGARPPGPKGSWGPTLAVIRDPRAAFEKWRAEFGDPFLVHALNGPIVVTGRPELVQQIFSEDPTTFAPFATDTIVPLLGAKSLLLMRGAEHKHERRLLSPMFHGQRMRAYAADMYQAAEEQLSILGGGQVQETLPVMTRISMEVIVRTVFGGQGQHEQARLLAAGAAVVRRSHPLLFFSRRMHFSLGGFSPWDRFQQARRRLFDAFDAELDRRARDSVQGEDILSLLASAQYEDGSPIDRGHVRDELMTFLLAGHETTALALTWAVYHVSRHAEVLGTLQAELDAAAVTDPLEYTQLPYLKAIVQETLRMYPIVAEVLRLLLRPMRLGDYELPAGMAVAAAGVLAHYDPTIYPEPDQFRPQRFLERTYSPFEYLPFGGGHRRCIGAALAAFEMAVVLGTLFSRYAPQLHEPRPLKSKRRNVTLGPSTGVRVQWTPRHTG